MADLVFIGNIFVYHNMLTRTFDHMHLSKQAESLIHMEFLFFKSGFCKMFYVSNMAIGTIRFEPSLLQMVHP